MHCDHMKNDLRHWCVIHGQDGEEFPAFRREGGMDFLGDICPPSRRPRTDLFHTPQGSYYSCLRRSSIISKCVCLGRTVTFACFPSLVKRLRRDRPLFQSESQTEGLCSCLLISPFNRLDISEARGSFCSHCRGIDQ